MKIAVGYNRETVEVTLKDRVLIFDALILQYPAHLELPCCLDGSVYRRLTAEEYGILVPEIINFLGTKCHIQPNILPGFRPEVLIQDNSSRDGEKFSPLGI